MHKRMDSKSVALVGVLAALSFVLLMIAALIPTGWLGMTAVAGIVIAVCVLRTGYISATFCYLVSAFVGLLLLPNKRVAIVYLCFFGFYPILKNIFEHWKRPIEYLAKICVFNLAFVSLYLVAKVLLFDTFISCWNSSLPVEPVLLIGGNIVFIIYDFAFSKVISYLQVRFYPNSNQSFKRE